MIPHILPHSPDRPVQAMGWVPQLWLGLLMLLGGHGVRAVEPLEVIDLRPYSLDHAAGEMSLPKGVGSTFLLHAPAPELLEVLRWAAPAPERSLCAESAAALTAWIGDQQWTQKPGSPSEIIPALLMQAREQLVFLDLQGVVGSLQRLRSHLPCADVILSLEQVRTLFLYEAVAHVLLEDSLYQSALADLLAVDPNFRLDGGYTVKVQRAFDEAVKRQQASDAIAWAAWPAPTETFLDGRSTRDAEALYVLPGRHVLQLRGPGGQVRGGLITVPSSPVGLAGKLNISDLAHFGLLSADGARAALAKALLEQQEDAEAIALLDAFLETHPHQPVAFAIVEAGGDVLIRRYEGNGRFSTLEDNAASRAPFAVHLALERWTLMGSQTAFLANNQMSGFVLQADLPREHLILIFEAAAMPRVRASSEAGPCPADVTSLTPSSEEVASAASCLSPGWAVAMTGGLGMPIELGPRASVTPIVAVGGAFLPGTLVSLPDYESVGEIVVVDLVAPGLEARLRAQAELKMERTTLLPSLELTAGLYYGWVEGIGVLAMPLGVRGGLGAAF